MTRLFPRCAKCGGKITQWYYLIRGRYLCHECGTEEKETARENND